MSIEIKQINDESVSENINDVLDIIDVQNKIIKKILEKNNILIDNKNNIIKEPDKTQSENTENESINE